jgi:hypothetical protein
MNTLDPKQLKIALKSKSREEQIRAVDTIQQVQPADGIPILLGALNNFTMARSFMQGRVSDRKHNKDFALHILKALCDLTATVHDLDPTVRKTIEGQIVTYYGTYIRPSDEKKDHDDAEFRLNVSIYSQLAILASRFGTKRLGADATLESVYKACFGWSYEEPSSHLRYATVADEIVTDEAQVKVALPLLLQELTGAEHLWARKSQHLGLAAGLLLAGFGTLLTTAIVTITKGMASGLAARQLDKAQSFLLLSPESINPRAFQSMSDPVRFLTALHAYGTGFAKLAEHYPDLVHNEFTQHQRSLEKSVLGFALAVNGNPTIRETLRRLSASTLEDDWSSKILAYEGLIALANHDRTADSVTIDEQIAALGDKDLRVRTAVAYVMSRTGNQIYWPHLAQLADSTESSLRKVALPALLSLAEGGDASADGKLRSISEQDKDKEVRESARQYLSQLQR